MDTVCQGRSKRHSAGENTEDDGLREGAVPACAGLKSVELGGTTFPGDPEKGPRSLEAIRGVGV